MHKTQKNKNTKIAPMSSEDKKLQEKEKVMVIDLCPGASIAMPLAGYNIGSIKEFLFHMFGCPLTDQVLTINGIEMADDTRYSEFDYDMSRVKIQFSRRFTRSMAQLQADDDDRKQMASPDAFQIFVHNFNGQVRTFHVYPDCTVLRLKQKICDREAVLPCNQRLIHCGRQLEDHCTMRDYNIHKESTMHLVGRLL